MSIKLKPVEQLKAQVAGYAAYQNEAKYTRRSTLLLERLGDIATDGVGMLSDSYYTLPMTSSYIEGGQLKAREKGTETPLFIGEEYKSFLKDPKNREVVANIADMISAYPTFEAKIREMGIIGLNYNQAKDHKDCLGQGGVNSGFGFSMEKDGEMQDFVAIIPHNPDNIHSISKVNGRVVSLALTRGMDGFEQGVAVSYENLVVIAKRAEGVEFGDMLPEDRSRIPLGHWEELRSKVKEASLKGVILDGNPYNFFYHPSYGFTVIDFRNNYGINRSPNKILEDNIHSTYLM